MNQAHDVVAEHLQQGFVALSDWRLAPKTNGTELEYTFDGNEEHTRVPTLLKRLGELGIEYKDLNTRQSSLEDIFVDLVSDRNDVAA